MSLTDLVVLHRRHDASQGSPAPAHVEDACIVRTCLRTVYIGPRSLLGPTANLAAVEDHVYEALVGADAYGFLLRLACGLESAIAGETEIFGQIKAAWRTFEDGGSLGARRLRSIVQRLFQDTKEIRTQHLTGLGSGTYGTLLRKLLGGRIEGRVLLVGAGQLAATMLPYLEGAQVAIWNRSPERVQALLSEVRARNVALKARLIATDRDAELAAWREADTVVLCIPPDAEHDAARVEAVRETRARVVHLGLADPKGTAWACVPQLVTLTDLFTMRDRQADQREAQLAGARRACAQKAQLAALEAGGTRDADHGWEDLTAFQALGS